MAIPEKYSHIDFTPPDGVVSEAKKALAWRREHGRGGTAVGIARARDLSNGKSLSPSTIRRMKAYFDRHQSDKSGEGWSPGDEGFPSNGRIAWALWGSDAAWAWSKKVVKQMEAADKERRGLRPYGSSHGMRPKVFVVHGAPRAGKADYVAKKMGDNDVVFDFDKVMAAISGGKRNDNLVSYCTDIRTLIINRSLRKPPIDRTWIITTRVGDEMSSMLSDIPVEYVHIDTPKDECLRRIEGDPNEGVLRTVIENYFSEQESRFSPAVPNVERRFLGNFTEQKADPEMLRVEKRSDPTTGKPRTYIVGYAARFHTDSLLLGDFIERIDPSAFDIVEKRADADGKPLETRCLYNHDPNHLLGRFPTTMRLTVDDKGLKYECLLPESRQDIAESVERGDLRGSSFSFVVSEGGERWSTENGRSIRLVTGIKALLDCGPVTYPAYGDATVAVAKRSYEQYRAFCATGAGGGIDNSCSGGASKQRVSSGPATVLGFAAGGAVGGVVGSAVGAHVGIAVDSYIHSTNLTKAMKDSGVTMEGIDSLAKSIGKDMTVSAGTAGEISVTGGGVEIKINTYDKTEVGKSLAGSHLHVTSGFENAIGEEGTESVGRLAKTLAKAAKSLGVDHVLVAVDAADKSAVSAFRTAGYDSSIKSEDGSQLTMIKSLKKTSKRFLAEMSEFLHSRRGGSSSRRDAGPAQRPSDTGLARRVESLKKWVEQRSL